MRRSSRALVLALGASLVAASPAAARVPAAGTSVDLKTRADVRITGAPADGLGAAVSAAGDVNGDGIADVLAGAPGGNRVYVVLGSQTATTFDATKRGTRGWVITGAGIGGEVAGVGDDNADGLDDVAVSAPGRSTAWVVFGSRSRKTVSTAKLGGRGFRIAGTANAAAGMSLAGVADLDRDGHADLAVAEPGTRTVWIVRGSESTAAVKLAAGARTRAISGLPAGTLGVAGVADVNGKGRGDILIGTPQADGNRGGAVLVFGESARSGVDVGSSAFTGGFRLGSAGAGTFTGAGVGGWGDTTGDKVPDLVVGTPGALAERTAAPASGYLVYGSRSDAPTLVASRRIGPTTPTGDRLGTSVPGGRAAPPPPGRPGPDPPRGPPAGPGRPGRGGPDRRRPRRRPPRPPPARPQGAGRLGSRVRGLGPRRGPPRRDRQRPGRVGLP